MVSTSLAAQLKLRPTTATGAGVRRAELQFGRILLQLYCDASHRDLGVELRHRQGHLERRLLPCEAGTRIIGGRLRRARLLRRALRHRGSELQLLRAPAARGEPRLGGADTDGFRLLD